MQKLFSINLATKKEFAETIGKMSTELRSKYYVKTNIFLKELFQFNSFFLECVAKSDRLGKELRIAEENLKKDLRGKNEIVLFFEID